MSNQKPRSKKVRYKYTIKTPNKTYEFKRLKDAKEFAQYCEGITIINYVRI
jgi:hypothetical protein